MQRENCLEKGEKKGIALKRSLFLWNGEL